MSLVTRKGVYPYEYTDSWEKLDEDSLPGKEEFIVHLMRKRLNTRSMITLWWVGSTSVVKH